MKIHSIFHYLTFINNIFTGQNNSSDKNKKNHSPDINNFYIIRFILQFYCLFQV